MEKTKFRPVEMVYIASFAVLIAACSWISIPANVPFTMQTFAVLLSILLLGGKRATLAVVVYLLLGAVGAPVFAGFSGGLGALLGSTGGYLFGFLAQTLLYWAIIKKPGERPFLELAVLIGGILLCYAIGTIWFVQVYTANTGPVSFMTALMWCVIPYIIPGWVKLALAYGLSHRLRRHVHL
ncbi:MAG: biotin transporter BioY [Eubacteriales bacterium]